MKNSYDRNVVLVCPVCGGKTFSYDSEDDNSTVTCTSCNKVFSRDEIIRANQENIDINAKEVRDEIIKDTSEDIKKMFKKHFGGK